MTHKLKELPEYYQAVFDGRKNFEVRKNDRDFNVGDTIVLQEWTENLSGTGRSGFTGAEITVTITYILNDNKYCKDGYVILGFAQPERVQIFNMTQNGNNNTHISMEQEV